MRIRWIVPLLAGAVAAAAPASAQENLSGIPTETQRRLAQGEPDVPWADLVGLIGLLGLLGLRRRHPEDGYRPGPIE